MSQTTGCEGFEAQRARKARVPQSAEKLTIRNPRPIVTNSTTHVMHARGDDDELSSTCASLKKSRS